MSIPVYMIVAKAVQTILLATCRNKDWTVMKALLEGGVKPALGNSKPRSYWWMEGAVSWNHFSMRA